MFFFSFFAPGVSFFFLDLVSTSDSHEGAAPRQWLGFGWFCDERALPFETYSPSLKIAKRQDVRKEFMV